MKKRTKRKAVRGKNKASKRINNKSLIFIILGIIIIAVIVYFIFINKPIETEEDSSIEEKPEADIIASFEWRDTKSITPYGERFYDKCDDGKNLGKIWTNIEILPIDNSLSFTCKTEIIVKDTNKIVDNYQLNLGMNRTKSGFIGYTEELAKQHLIKICCKSKKEIDSFCKTFEMPAYC